MSGRLLLVLCIAVAAGFGWFIWALISVEAEAANYIASHDCAMTERREGYYTTIYMQVGNVMVPNLIWNSPRGYFACTTGEGRWTFVE